MKILVIGRGGREHAIIKTIKKFNSDVTIYCAPGNGGTQFDAVNVKIDELNFNEIKNFAINNKIDFVIVTPDNPLAEGLVDVLQSENILCFGPNKKAARIESSKVFAKNLMKKYSIKTANFEIFNNPQKAIKYVQQKSIYPIVIKADGLAYGKGVVVAQNFEEANVAINNIMINKQFKQSGDQIIIEEFLNGTEVSILCLTDGITIKPLVSSLDHKKAFDNDLGPNTGGMGAISPHPLFNSKLAEICMNTIFMPTINALKNEGCFFCGCIYFGLILTTDGPKVLEYNCRFGDPETQAILPLLKTNLLDLLIATSTQNLNKFNLEFSSESTACVVLSSKGYPIKFQTGYTISGLTKTGLISNEELANEIEIYHSGTIYQNDVFKTNAGRVLSVVAKKQNLEDAIKTAYRAANLINFENKFLRSDIGFKYI